MKSRILIVSSSCLCALCPGTKLYQCTRSTITKQKPALLLAIKRFNKYCSQLATLHHSEWSIPLPEPLLTGLTALCASDTLMEDVWISPAISEVPRWLEDSDICDGIHALLKLDRCHEEWQQLSLEAENLCRWFGEEFAAVECALHTVTGKLVIDFLISLMWQLHM